MKIAVHGSYFANNFGDTLLIREMIRMVKEAFPEAEIKLATKGNDEEQKSLAVPVVKPGEEDTFDILIYAGGGYFGEPNVSYLRRLKWYLRNYFRHLAWAKKYINAKVLMLGVGVGPISSRIYRFLAKPIVSNAELLLVRDMESKKFLKSYFDRDTEIVTDLALTLDNRTVEKNNDFLLHIDRLDGNSIAKIISAAKVELNRFDSVKVIFDNSSASSEKTINKYKQCFIEFDFDLSKVEYIPYENVDTLIDLISASRLVLTAKLHVGIVAISQGTPVISVPVHQKTVRLYKQLGISNYCIPVKELSSDRIVRTFNSISEFEVDDELISLSKDKYRNAINLINEK